MPQRPHVLPPRRLGARGARARPRAARARLGRDGRLGLARRAAATPSASTPGSTCTPSTSTAATRRCTRPTRTAPTRPTASSPPSTTTPTRPTSPPGARALEDAGAADADVLHLHHLTPIHEAAARVAPDVPVVGHLHGTELLMLERIADGPPAGWAHAEAWARRMRRWAARCERLLLLSPQPARARRARCWASTPARCVVAPNGFDPERFAPRTVDRAALLAPAPRRRPAGLAARARRGLGRLPTRAGGRRGRAGPSCCRSAASPRSSAWGCSCAPSPAPARRCASAAAGVAGARRRLPGGVGGRAPATTRSRATGARDVFLAGWHEHDDAARRSSPPPTPSCSPRCASSSARSSSRAWPAGCPPIAVDRFGPADIVRPGQTGWLVEPDDEAALAGALGAGDRPARGAPAPRRGRAPRRDARASRGPRSPSASAGSSPRWSTAADDDAAVAATDS